MRHTLFLILIWMPLLICATDKNVNITIKLSTELSQTEQWIYASGYIGANEYAILDSVKVSKGDIKKKLSFDISQGMSIYILCAEKGPVNLFFHIEPNTNCEIEIDENMDGRYPRPMKGNDMQNELLAFDNKILYIGKKSEDQSLPEDSIRYIYSSLRKCQKTILSAYRPYSLLQSLEWHIHLLRHIRSHKSIALFGIVQ
jgi:hypothetical protein